jgi:hypothetical protein
MTRSLLALPLALGLTLSAPAADEKPAAGPVVLTVVAKTDKYAFDGGGKTPAEYKKDLEAIAQDLDNGGQATPPMALAVDLVLRLTNTSKEDVTIYVGGNPNVYTFDLTGGAGAVTMRNPVAFPAIFIRPKAVTLEPGKAHEIPVKSLSDGRRGLARLVFWTGPGEYKLAAKYTLSDAKGGKGTELTSEPVKITVTEK